MTEDDTFRILKHRIQFYDMMKLYRSGIGPSWSNKHLNDIAEKFGITFPLDYYPDRGKE